MVRTLILTSFCFLGVYAELFIILSFRASHSVFTAPLNLHLDYSEGFRIRGAHVHYRFFKDFLLPQQIHYTSHTNVLNISNTDMMYYVTPAVKTGMLCM